ncbi:MAG: S8 family peptidase [Bacteroidota bacterium]
MKSVGLSFILIITSGLLFGQTNEDWYNEDVVDSGLAGASVDKASELVTGKQPKEVIVAVIDSGIDVDHEDLKENIWVNEDEIPGNGIDDDNNGYVDDINGWSFLGGKDGNIVEALYETTRIFRRLKPKFEGRTKSSIKPAEEEEYELYKETKKETEKQYKKTLRQIEDFRVLEENLSIVSTILETELLDKPITEENVKAISSVSERVLAARDYMMRLYENEFVQEDFDAYMKDLRNRVKYHYNIDFDPRKVVGDNPEDPFEKDYGNNQVSGNYTEHGTHVAGIIGAKRGNGLGIDGVAHKVKLMVLRAVPDGDERDKDVANSIIYAVDNGAKIINMSFGKGHSPEKQAVDKAVKYAEEKGVLLINSAGNAHINVDKIDQFPSRTYTTNGYSGEATNWITVGASGSEVGPDLAADFTNYGRKNVDIFAPGVDIYSTVPGNQYKEQDGTSMAAPVVSGVAALVLNYYPDLTATQLKEVLLASATDYKKTKVYIPGDDEERLKTKFKKLSVTGKVINAYSALQYAAKKYN